MDASDPARAALAAASLLPGHCLERSAMLANAESNLQGALQAAAAAATFARSVEGAAAPQSERQASLRTTALRLLAPPVAVAQEWLPASETTNAAWLLARAAAENNMVETIDGEKRFGDGPQDAGNQDAGDGDDGGLHNARNRVSVEDAHSTLRDCRSVMEDGAPWQDVVLRRYMVSAAMVRQLAGSGFAITYGRFRCTSPSLG